MEAMGYGHPHRFAQLWQLPLLLFSLGLFAYAAYLFIDPRGGLTIDDKIEIARIFLKQERPEAALQQLNLLLRTEKMEPAAQARAHMLIAQSLEQGQKQKKINIRANHVKIIEQTRRAQAYGLEPDADAYRRIGESYEALDRSAEALENYRRAAAMDEGRSLRLLRKVIELQLDGQDPGPARASIEEYLRHPEIESSEKAWALAAQARLLIDRGSFVEARTLLGEALALDLDPVSRGEVYYWIGHCEWKLGDGDEAEKHLRASRDLLKTQHPLDADAAYVLGRVLQDRNQPTEAATFFQSVLVSFPDAKVAPLAKLGRGMCRLMLAQDDAGLIDLHDLVNQINQKASKSKYRDEVVSALRKAGELLTSRKNYRDALEVLAYEQSLVGEPGAEFFARLANVYEKRADQLQRQTAGAAPSEELRLTEQVRKLRTNAGDAYVAYSRALVLVDDQGYGQAMWKGIRLYDEAANVHAVIASLELFVAERPEDPLASDALLRLGQAYQAAGQFDKAIAAYQRNQFRYPNSLAASKSGVPLALAYVAKGPEFYSKAEGVLLRVVENNPLLTPDAEEFRQALFELAQLYYRTNRFEEAVVRLEELTQRYPDDKRKGQLLFLMADSYRKSATRLGVRLEVADAADPKAGALDAAEAATARKQRLGKAKDLYDGVIELYRQSGAPSDLDKLYLKLSHFYRADCLYDLGRYDDAINLYDTAARRYVDDPSALTAYVQIVNSFCALGRIDDAKTANERAKWLLRRMPPEAFSDGTFSMPKAYWEQWLKWTGDAGMW